MFIHFTNLNNIFTNVVIHCRPIQVHFRCTSFHQIIVSLLFALFARVKVFAAHALIRSPKPNPSSLLRQASLGKRSLIVRHRQVLAHFWVLLMLSSFQHPYIYVLVSRLATWWSWCFGCAACSDFDPDLGLISEGFALSFEPAHSLDYEKKINFLERYFVGKLTLWRSKCFSTSWCLEREGNVPKCDQPWWWNICWQCDDDRDHALAAVQLKQLRQRHPWRRPRWEQSTLCKRWHWIAFSMT